ncbi:MAG: efflux RND transporter periplasmic adaptor subunit, partial [Pseudomonadota bacterium]
GGYLFNEAQPQVAVARVARGPAVAGVYATGTVEPVAWAKVGPTAAGRLVAVLARDGAAVVAGQALARLDDREARARLTELEARERYWRDEVQRQAALAERGFASRESRDRAHSEHLQAQAVIAAQRQRLTDLTLTAPMNGIVLRQDGEVGEVAEARQILFWIGQPKPLRITAEIDEEDIPRVAVGQRVLVKADAFAGQELTGAVADITPKGDPVSKSYRVRVALPADTPLRIGMTTEINVIVRRAEDVLLVPAGALAGGRVFVVEEGIARARGVRTGIVGRTMVEITDGLSEGELVVVGPPERLGDGMRVRAGGRPEAAGPRT